MKKYRVIVVPAAQAGIREAYDFIHERAPLSAVRWLQELYRRIRTLESFPDRCPPAREREFFEENLRQLVFRSYRIVFYADRSRRTVYTSSPSCMRGAGGREAFPDHRQPADAALADGGATAAEAGVARDQENLAPR